ncbi:MAG: pyridoxal phosphate-dependent transferase [Paenibacillus sp.]|jgi:hypothetical protein|nr:pyridoxal phosphate-dependent transferase [Paenibacillus sp.]
MILADTSAPYGYPFATPRLTELAGQGNPDFLKESRNIELEKIINDIKCPNKSKRVRQELRSMNSFTPKLMATGRFDDAWDTYPFHSGYFLCLKLKKVKAEALRVQLLEKYQIGTIVLNETDVRVAFSRVDEVNLEELFNLIYQGVNDLLQKTEK